MGTETNGLQNGNLLQLQNIVKAYGRGNKQFIAIRDINMSIVPGEFVCLVGPSGCGKSTLLRIITGLNTATSGTVLYRGEPLKGVNPNATIVFQTFALYPWLTVLENVEIALKAHGVPFDGRKARALKLIHTVGLDGFDLAYPRELSGGMRQKVGFARAMAIEPELLCLDEPFSALDVLSAEALRGELMELWLNKAIPTKAILMVTHNIEEAVLLADRIIVMGKEPGHIVTEVRVGLRHPRERKDTAFQAQVDKVYAAVAGRNEPAIEISGGWTKKKLPPTRLYVLTGLIEKLAAEGGHSDLNELSGDLMLDLDDLLPVVEAGEIIEFITIREGTLTLTPLGQAYADASILARKELLAGRILRLPIISWIYETLQRDDNQHVAWSYFFDEMKGEFGEESEALLDTAINWGRHAELFAYDDNTGELFMES
ncbi:MAG: ATP-binding cassette domain-containing protein [Chlorobiales bacterium]|nr:ATP-binding cassette domain-containing protein [Chlorobiales bacterium]